MYVYEFLMSLYEGFYEDINSISIIFLIQDISESDIRLRRQFCRWVLQMIRKDPTFFQYILFSDEVSFITMDNRYNCHYWSTYNPHWTQRIDNQHR